MINEILEQKNIILDKNFTTKEEVIHALSELLCKNGYIKDLDKFINDVYKRELEGFTGAGSKIAIPHGISKETENIFVAICRTAQDIEWSRDCEIEEMYRKVKLIILFAVPEDDTRSRQRPYIKALKAIMNTLGVEENISKMMTAKSAEEIIKIFNADDF